jgi:hypothetical protein
MKILVLILASDSAPEYIEFQSIWKMYMNLHPKIDCYFYKGDPTLPTEAVLRGNTLLLRIEESLDTVYEKTLRAFRFFEPQLSNYTFVYRTNLSSFIDFGKYIQVCASLPKTECCAAFVGTDDDGVPFPSGAGFTLSPDLVRRLLRENPPLLVQDDITIGHALHQWGIPIVPVNRADYVAEENVFIFKCFDLEMPTFHYRVKSDDRNLDVIALRTLVTRNHPSEWLWEGLRNML